MFLALIIILKSYLKIGKNNLWVATNNGVLKFRQSPFFCYNEINNIKGSFCSVDDSQGNICLKFGLYKKDERATDFEKILKGDINFVIDKNDNIIMYDAIKEFVYMI